jgi:hypothetical protein
MSMFVDDPKTVMLGTGPGERWLGLEAIREAHLRFFDSFDSEESKATWRIAQIDGNVAWGASMRVVTDYYKNIKREFYLNISAVLVKKDGKWQISMFHFSNLTGSDGE